MKWSLFCLAWSILDAAPAAAAASTGGWEPPAAEHAPLPPSTEDGLPVDGAEATTVVDDARQLARAAGTTTADDATANRHCVDHADCESCNGAGWCHWCGTAKGCHVRGSVSGCVRGETCRDPTPTPPDANNDTCLAHVSCSDCAAYSRWCHWCAHDNACHRVGSFYGCVQGVDCYDITHCKRADPEPMEEDDDESGHYRIGRRFGFDLPRLRPIPALLAGILAAATMSCATMCCCAVSFTKNAYNDLVNDFAATTPLLSPSSEEDGDGADGTEHHHHRHHHDAGAADAASGPDPAAEGGDDHAAAEIDRDADSANQQQSDSPTAAADLGPAATAAVSPWMTARSTTTPRTSAASSRQRLHNRPLPRGGRTIHRLYNVCVGCYLTTILAVVVASYAIVKYFPQPPGYSICNDSIAWQSIVDAMARMAVAADFELLASIENPNHLDVDVVAGNGSFYHKDDFVGTFAIPPTTIERRSVTDLLVTATFAPDKWKALSIGAEYYAGTLMLTLDSSVTIRVPALFDYTFTVTVRDIAVDVNQAADRHLCACPTWSDTRTSAPRWLSMTTDEDATTPLMSSSSSSSSSSG